MVSITPFIKSFVVNFTPSSEYDVDLYKIYACHEDEFSNGDFTPSASTLIAEGPDTAFLYDTPKGGVWGVKVCAVDTFGDDLLNYSQLYTVTVPTLDPLDQIAPNVPTWVALPAEAITGIESGEVGEAIFVAVAWELAAKPEDFLHYILAYKTASDTRWNEITTTAESFKLTNVLGGVSYEFKVLAVDQWNNASAYTEVQVVESAKDTVPPAAPTDVTATAGFGSVSVQWVNPPDLDLDRVVIYRSEVNDVTTSSEIGSVYGTAFVDPGRATGVTYYYWLKAVDTSGNVSVDYSNGASAIPIQIMSSDLDISARVDFVVRDSVFLFEHVEAPAAASTTLSWTAGSISRGDTSFALSGGSLTDAANSYVVATLDTTATLSVIPYSSQISNLASNQIIIAFTSATPLADTNNYVCYVRQSNSMAIEGAVIRDASITTAKIKDLTADKITTGTLDAAKVTITNLEFSDLGGSISWAGSVITDKPSSLADISAADATKLTHIDSRGIYTGTLNVTQLNAGTYTGTGIGIGDAKITIDGVNSRITVANNAGTVTDMVTVGKLSTGNYGISVKDKAGLQVLRVDDAGATLQNLTAGTIDANKVTINNLVVGGNVAMGPNAYISWENVTSQPTIPTNTNQLTDGAGLGTTASWTSVSGRPNTTYIDANGIYTGTLTADQVNAVTIDASSITVGTLTGIAITGQTITGGTIGGATITGGTVQTSTGTTASVKMYSATSQVFPNSIVVYDESGNVRVRIGRIN